MPNRPRLGRASKLPTPEGFRAGRWRRRPPCRRPRAPAGPVGQAARRLAAALREYDRLFPVRIAGSDRRAIELRRPIAFLKVDRLAELAPAAPTVELGEAVAQRLCRRVLHDRVQGRTNPQATRIEAVRPVL